MAARSKGKDYVPARARVALAPGDAVRVARELQGMTQSGLADACGIPQGTISSLESGRITESYLLRLLETIGPGTYELYAHPDEDSHEHETEALCSPKVREMIRQRGIELTRYSDLIPK